MYDTKHSIIDVSYDETRKILITVGSDRTIKVIGNHNKFYLTNHPHKLIDFFLNS